MEGELLLGGIPGGEGGALLQPGHRVGGVLGQVALHRRGEQLQQAPQPAGLVRVAGLAALRVAHGVEGVRAGEGGVVGADRAEGRSGLEPRALAVAQRGQLLEVRIKLGAERVKGGIHGSGGR